MIVVWRFSILLLLRGPDYNSRCVFYQTIHDIKTCMFSIYMSLRDLTTTETIADSTKLIVDWASQTIHLTISKPDELSLYCLY